MATANFVICGVLFVGTIACYRARNWRTVTLPMVLLWTAIVAVVLAVLRREPLTWWFWDGTIIFLTPTGYARPIAVRFALCTAIACTIWTLGFLAVRAGSWLLLHLRRPTARSVEADDSPAP